MLDQSPPSPTPATQYNHSIATNLKNPVRFLVAPVWILAIYALGLLMGEAATVCLWIVCSFFLFVLLDPLAEKLKAYKWPTAWTAIFLVLTATIISTGLVYGLGYLFSSMVVELESSKQLFMHTFETFNTTWNSWTASLPGFHPAAVGSHNVAKVEVVQGSPFGGEVGSTVLRGLGSAVTILTFALLVPILAFFFLAERDSFARNIKGAYLDPEMPAKIWDKIVDSTRAFFLGNLVLAAVTYPVFLILFWAFSVPSTFTVAALATFFNLVPFLGAVMSGFLPAVALYSQSQHIGTTFGMYGICVAIHFAVADFVTPKILGSRVNINATTSTIALVAWGEVWGGVGLILAIPLTSLIKVLFEHSNYFWLKWLAGLMSEKADHALENPSVTTEAQSASLNSGPAIQSEEFSGKGGWEISGREGPSMSQ